MTRNLDRPWVSFRERLVFRVEENAGDACFIAHKKGASEDLGRRHFEVEIFELGQTLETTVQIARQRALLPFRRAGKNRRRVLAFWSRSLVLLRGRRIYCCVCR